MLSEMDKLKAENLKLRAQVFDLQRMLAEAKLSEEQMKLDRDRQALEAEYRLILKPEEGEVFNWQTLTFDPAK